MHQLEEEGGLHLCKNTFTNLKITMTIPDHNGTTAGKTDHLNPEKVEENYLKSNFMKIIEKIKEKKSFKKM